MGLYMKPLNIFGRLLIFSIVFLIVQILPAPSGDIGFMSAQAQVWSGIVMADTSKSVVYKLNFFEVEHENKEKELFEAI